MGPKASSADKEQVTQLKKTGTTTAYANYAYDDAGNQTQRSYPAGTLLDSPSESGNAETFDYVYDGDDRLRRVTKRVSNVVTGSEEYWYDNGGQRIAVLKRNASGVVQELRWFIGDTQAHYDAAGVVTKTYAHVALGTPVARVERTSNTATAIEYQFHGLASNMISAVSTAGVVNVNVAYAPYGETVESQQPAGAAGTAVGMPAHRRRMNDKYVDEIGSLAYYGARYYDNVLIGWTQGDPMYRVAPDAAWQEPRRANLYMFTLSNPLSYIAPDGMDIVKQKVYIVQYRDTSTARDLKQTRTRLINAIEALPSGRIAAIAKQSDARIAVTDSKGQVTGKHSNVVLYDSNSRTSVAAAGSVSEIHARGVSKVKANAGTYAASKVGGPESVIDLRRVQNDIDRFRAEHTHFSKDVVEAAIIAFINNLAEHEVAHNLGLKDKNGKDDKEATDETEDIMETKRRFWSKQETFVNEDRQLLDGMFGSNEGW
jgi:RHS repeat-associated protein